MHSFIKLYIFHKELIITKEKRLFQIFKRQTSFDKKKTTFKRKIVDKHDKHFFLYENEATD